MLAIHNIAEICARKGLTDVILSPGSRCAPLTLAFVRHPDISTKTISDERSAAFIAIGIAQQTKKTTGLVCTSGSAAYNYAPAVAEAFFQQIPLIVFTADRPPEWIDQLDGQTIRQENIYGKHVKASYTLPVDHTHPDAQWHIARTVSEAINLSQEYPRGPVHINVPLREPFYPEEAIHFNKDVPVIERKKSEKMLDEATWKELLEEYERFPKVLIVSGQSDVNTATSETLDRFSAEAGIPVLADIIANIHKKNILRHHDIILSGKEDKYKNLSPDLLITFGQSVLSKNLKQFLRKYKPSRHWHIQESGYTADTFKSLSTVLPVSPSYFFSELKNKVKTAASKQRYLQLWKEEEKKSCAALQHFFSTESRFSEFSALNKILNLLPDHSILHLANSMPVRYANYTGLPEKMSNIEVYSNRGTSGIDGVISTAFGAALATDKIVTVVTGDMAFFYDRNAFWNNYIPSNLRVVILNNHGGGIFRIIDGPDKQPELDEYFETKQKLIAENTAKDHNLGYVLCKSDEELDSALNGFFIQGAAPKILEVETDSKSNVEVFHNFKRSIQ